MMIDNVFWCHVVPKFGRNGSIVQFVSVQRNGFKTSRMGIFAHGEAGFLGVGVVRPEGLEPPTFGFETRCRGEAFGAWP
jgi:hypothetical protein